MKFAVGATRATPRRKWSAVFVEHGVGNSPTAYVHAASGTSHVANAIQSDRPDASGTGNVGLHNILHRPQRCEQQQQQQYEYLGWTDHANHHVSGAAVVCSCSTSAG